MGKPSSISRRDFIHLAGLGLGAVLLSTHKLALAQPAQEWPSLSLEALPPKVFEILSLVPNVWVGQDGIVYQSGWEGENFSPVTQAYTQWNQERSSDHDRLRTELPWAIVLHWFGDKDNTNLDLKGYLRGFDSLREVDGMEIRTSAHFLVGPRHPNRRATSYGPVGIVQTQAPDADGVPFLASHLAPIDKVAYVARRQYFVSALNNLSYDDPAAHSLLQDFYQGRYMDQNRRTLAIEITGYDFEHPEHFPPPQQIANVVALVWALMKRYQMQATNLLGHLEIQLNKADPGKKFMALIRQLIGIRALVEDDEQMISLVFGQFSVPNGDPLLAVDKYFKFVRDYLALTSVPRTVFEWEAACNYWLCQGLLAPSAGTAMLAGASLPPLASNTLNPGRIFLDPENHEGVDFYQDSYNSRVSSSSGQAVQLVTPGTCLYLGEAGYACHGKTAIFQHILPTGSQVLSVYGHLGQLGDLNVGKTYPMAYRVGETPSNVSQGGRYMHFAMAYGVTWDLYLSTHPTLPLNIGQTWIRDRYISPLEYLAKDPSFLYRN